jgi:hypothetical protein
MKNNRRDFLKKTLYVGLAQGITSIYAGMAQSMNSGTLSIPPEVK